MVKKINDVNIPQLNIQIKQENLTSNGSGGILLNTAIKKWGIKNLLGSTLATKKRASGYSDICYQFSLIANFISGGIGLNSLDVLERDENFRNIIGLGGVPDPASMGEYLRRLSGKQIKSLSDGSVKLTERIISGLSKKEITYGGWLHCFVDGSLLEVSGKKREGTEKIDRNGKRSLLMMNFFMDDFLANMSLHPGNVHECNHLIDLMMPYKKILKRHKVHLFLDSAYYDHKIIEDFLDEQGYYYTISVNKATSALDAKAGKIKEGEWEKVDKEKVFNGDYDEVYVSELEYWPNGWCREHRYAVIKCVKKNEMFPYYFYILTNREDLTAKEVVEHHKIKGGFENNHKNLLCDLNLHHPPMQKLNANVAYYTMAMMSHNIIHGIKKSFLPAENIANRTRTILHKLLNIPARVVKHARRVIVSLESVLLTEGMREMFTDFRQWYPLLR